MCDEAVLLLRGPRGVTLFLGGGQPRRVDAGMLRVRRRGCGCRGHSCPPGSS